MPLGLTPALIWVAGGGCEGARRVDTVREDPAGVSRAGGGAAGIVGGLVVHGGIYSLVVGQRNNGGGHGKVAPVAGDGKALLRGGGADGAGLDGELGERRRGGAGDDIEERVGLVHRESGGRLGEGNAVLLRERSVSGDGEVNDRVVVGDWRRRGWLRPSLPPWQRGIHRRSGRGSCQCLRRSGSLRIENRQRRPGWRRWCPGCCCRSRRRNR